MVVGHHLGKRVPVAGQRNGPERSYARVAAFSSRGVGRLSSSNLASAASRSASSKSSQRVISSPSTVTAGSPATRRRSPSREVPFPVGDDCTEVGQPMHGLDVEPESGVTSHVAWMYAVMSPGANAILAGGRC